MTAARKASRASKLALLHGAARLGVDATIGVTDIVEAMHHAIASRVLGARPRADGRTRFIAGLVYRSVRGITRTVGVALDAALGHASRARREDRATLESAAHAVAALNGVLGDHLAASGNPLALPMTLRRDGRDVDASAAGLAAAYPDARAHVVVLVHGLCMDDLRWRRGGHDHGAALASALDASAVYVRYNSGLPVARNGRGLARLLEALVEEWPAPIERIDVVAHSMGGLVARSACVAAERDGRAWRERLRSIVFLGTPHHGAPLERAGSVVDLLLERSVFSAPLARIGRVRSAGIVDLRHGAVLDRDADGVAPALPAAVRCYALAGTIASSVAAIGDGLVPVASALGDHEDASRALGIPRARRRVLRDTGHLDLLGSPAAFERIRDWLRG